MRSKLRAKEVNTLNTRIFVILILISLSFIDWKVVIKVSLFEDFWGVWN